MFRIKQRGSLPSLVLSIDGDGEGGGGGNNDGQQSTHWAEAQGLPEDIRSWDEVKKSDTPEKFWGQMSEMRSHLGQSIRFPSEDAGVEDIQKFNEKVMAKAPGLMQTPDFENEETLNGLYSKMGKPEKAEDYVIPEIKDAEGQVVDPATLDMSLAETFKEIAFKRNLTKKQYADAVNDITQINLADHAALIAEQKADHDKLQSLWGAASEQNHEIVKNFISKVDAPDHVANAINTGQIDTATMVWFHKLATQTLGRGADFQGDRSGGDPVMTPTEATDRIREIRNNPDHPFNNKNDKGHKDALLKMQDLYYLKNPKGGKNTAPGTVFEIGGPK